MLNTIHAFCELMKRVNTEIIYEMTITLVQRENHYMRVTGLILLVCLLNGCVTNYKVDAGNMSDIRMSKEPPSLQMLKLQMSSCATQYAISSKESDLSFNYSAKNGLVEYWSKDQDFVTSIKSCAGANYAGNEKDSGNLTISGIGK